MVETASLASVEPPDVWYELSLPNDIIDNEKLSALQLEALVYAAQQHEQKLADGNRLVNIYLNIKKLKNRI